MTDEIREAPVDGFDGWTRITNGTNIQFRHENTGTVLSNYKFAALKRKYLTQHYIPESEIMGADSTSTGLSNISSDAVAEAAEEAFVQPKVLSQTRPTPGGSKYGFRHPNSTMPPPSYAPPPRARVVDSDPMKDMATDIKPHQRPRNIKHPRPSARDLGIGFKKLLLLLTTGIVVRLLGDARAGMTEQEAEILGTALGNLLENTGVNQEYGWIVAETGDWQAIGYVLMMYVGRINDIVQEKKNTSSQNTFSSAAGGTVNSTPAQPAPPAQSNGHAQVVPDSLGRPIVPPNLGRAGMGPQDLTGLR